MGPRLHAGGRHPRHGKVSRPARRAGRELLPEPLAGGPPGVFAEADSGLLDVALDPDFARNRVLFLSFAEGDAKANRTAVWRARYEGGRLVDGRVIFRAAPDKAGPGHPGGRLLFLPDGTLLLTVGDGFDYKDAAQDMGSHLGKILRLTRDGAAPPDNPFAGRDGARPEIWTSGHRNPQGLDARPVTGDVWEHEHGPRGGDEVNRLRAGANYGWPLVTHGIDYDLSIVSERAFAPGIERSWFFWAPSIAPSGLAVYRGRPSRTGTASCWSAASCRSRSAGCGRPSSPGSSSRKSGCSARRTSASATCAWVPTATSTS